MRCAAQATADLCRPHARRIPVAHTRAATICALLFNRTSGLMPSDPSAPAMLRISWIVKIGYAHMARRLMFYTAARMIPGSDRAWRVAEYLEYCAVYLYRLQYADGGEIDRYGRESRVPGRYIYS